MPTKSLPNKPIQALANDLSRLNNTLSFFQIFQLLHKIQLFVKTLAHGKLRGLQNEING